MMDVLRMEPALYAEESVDDEDPLSPRRPGMGIDEDEEEDTDGEDVDDKEDWDTDEDDDDTDEIE